MIDSHKAAAQGFAITVRSFAVRLIRVRLPSGGCEFLATSLLATAAFPAHEFAALYHRRWRIEECFKQLKCRLAVEHFSGELPASIRQDFLAKVWLGNLVATFACMFTESGWRDALRYWLLWQTNRIRYSPPHLPTSIRN